MKGIFRDAVFSVLLLISIPVFSANSHIIYGFDAVQGLKKDSRGEYYIQAGSFVNKDNAVRYRQVLASKTGYPVSISHKSKFNIVRVGPLSTYADVHRAAGLMQSDVRYASQRRVNSMPGFASSHRMSSMSKLAYAHRAAPTMAYARNSEPTARVVHVRRPEAMPRLAYARKSEVLPRITYARNSVTTTRVVHMRNPVAMPKLAFARKPVPMSKPSYTRPSPAELAYAQNIASMPKLASSNKLESMPKLDSTQNIDSMPKLASAQKMESMIKVASKQKPAAISNPEPTPKPESMPKLASSAKTSPAPIKHEDILAEAPIREVAPTPQVEAVKPSVEIAKQSHPVEPKVDAKTQEELALLGFGNNCSGPRLNPQPKCMPNRPEINIT